MSFLRGLFAQGQKLSVAQYVGELWHSVGRGSWERVGRELGENWAKFGKDAGEILGKSWERVGKESRSILGEISFLKLS